MPWLAFAQAAVSGISMLSAQNNKNQAAKAEKAAENLPTPVYTPNKSIVDYYDEAVRRYRTSPTDTAEYKLYNQQVRQGTTQAFGSLNKLRSGNVAGVVYNQNNALLKGAVAAEQQKAQQFGVVGRAAGMKTGEDSKAFQFNQIAPFEKQYNLLTAKAGGNRQAQNAQTQNAYNNALSAAATWSDYKNPKGGEGSWSDNINGSIFGSKGSRAEARWNKGGQQWWQN